MNIEERERLVRVEEKYERIEDRLTELRVDIRDMKDVNDARINELKEILLRPTLLEKVVIGTGAFVKENWKTLLVIIIAIATGSAGSLLSVIQ